LQAKLLKETHFGNQVGLSDFAQDKKRQFDQGKKDFVIDNFATIFDSRVELNNAIRINVL
jgi:hypothetical protein